MNDDDREAALTAAARQATKDGTIWRAPSFEVLLALMRRLGTEDPQVTRAKLTEIWVEGASVFGVVRAGEHLEVGKWHARKGTLGDDPTLLLFVLTVVTDEIYAAVRGRSPDQWQI